ncbi:MAG: dienelactone hydrolase family protein [Pseudomonadota bacterium]
MIDGPRIAPRQRATSLVVLLHGYGADGNDLIGLAEAWRDLLPATAFVAPHAPQPLPFEAMGGRQWFDLTMRDPTELRRGTLAAAPALTRFLDAELARHALAPDRLALVGFSQGTMMALHVGLRRSVAPAAIVGYSGVIAGAEHLRAEIACHPPVQLVHGELDELIPVGALAITREALAAAGVPVEWHIAPGLGHGIDPEGLALGGGFLAEHLE